jgi:hypothetical protein
MLKLLTRRAQRMANSNRGTVFVEYSSLVLLIAIAAIALLAHVATPSN